MPAIVSRREAACKGFVSQSGGRTLKTVLIATRCIFSVERVRIHDRVGINPVEGPKDPSGSRFQENAMTRFLKWFGRTENTRPASATRHPVFRPQLEQLDERLLLSMSSAITIPHGWGTEYDWYAVDNSSRQVVMFSNTNRYNLGGPGNIGGVSASIDPRSGYGEVFALSVYNSRQFNFDATLWLCDSSGNWHNFGGDYTGISATRDGHVYAVTADGASVWYLDSYGNGTDLGAPNTGSGPFASPSLAAGIAWFGWNEVFAIGPGLAIYVNSGNAAGQWRLVDNSARFISLSAANDTVFALTWDGFGQGGKLYQETEHLRLTNRGGYFYWTDQDISGGRLYSTISADTDPSGRAEVYAVDTNTYLLLYDQGASVVEFIGVYDVSGAGGGYRYVVALDKGADHAYQENPDGSAIYLGSGIL
jgi:hypothetical protein